MGLLESFKSAAEKVTNKVATLGSKKKMSAEVGENLEYPKRRQPTEVPLHEPEPHRTERPPSKPVVQFPEDMEPKRRQPTEVPLHEPEPHRTERPERE